MTAAEVLQQVRQAGAQLRVVDDQLRGPRDLAPDLRAAVAAHKAELVALLVSTCPRCGLQGSPARPNGWWCAGEGVNGSAEWKPGCLHRWGQDPADPPAPPDEPCRHATTSTVDGVSTCLRCGQTVE